MSSSGDGFHEYFGGRIIVAIPSLQDGNMGRSITPFGSAEVRGCQGHPNVLKALSYVISDTFIHCDQIFRNVTSDNGQIIPMQKNILTFISYCACISCINH